MDSVDLVLEHSVDGEVLTKWLDEVALEASKRVSANTVLRVVRLLLAEDDQELRYRRVGLPRLVHQLFRRLDHLLVLGDVLLDVVLPERRSASSVFLTLDVIRLELGDYDIGSVSWTMTKTATKQLLPRRHSRGVREKLGRGGCSSGMILPHILTYQKLRIRKGGNFKTEKRTWSSSRLPENILTACSSRFEPRSRT